MTPPVDRCLRDFRERHPGLSTLCDAVAKAAALICRASRAGGLVLACGNGGSAADSEHIVGELVKGFCRERPLAREETARMEEAGLPAGLAAKLQRGVRGVALPSQVSAVTAVLNDADPALVFAQQVLALGRSGDVLIALSTSGNSADVVAALRVARALGLSTIGLSGRRACAMDGLCDVSLKVPAEETAHVQELHVPVYHLLCRLIEEQLFGEGSGPGQQPAGG